MVRRPRGLSIFEARSPGGGPLVGIRGQSNVIGAVLLIGMVITSATLIVMAGGSVLDQYRELAGQESTTNAIEEIDTELSSVASVGGLTRTEFSLGDARPSQYRIVRSGHINVTSNRNASCRAHIPLSSLRYERDDGVMLGYEAGGIWRQEDGVLSQTVMHTPPDVTFENGTLSMTVVNVSGSVEQSKNLVYENVTKSIQTNNALQDSLFSEGCARPDNVTVSVTSDFYRGWSRYFRGSIDATSYETFESNQTTRVFLDQNVLPVETNDSSNDVVDLTSSEFNDVTVTSNSITVNKNAGNTYTTIVTPLSSGSTQVGEIRVVEGDDVYRPPLDVIFVVDESGSMGGNKMYNAKEAAKTFTGKMNASYDRAGVVGFENDGEIKVTDNGEYLTNDFSNSGVNGSIDDLYANGGTDISAGLHEGNVMFGLTSNSSRKKVIVLLSDGDNSCSCDDDDTIDEAEIASKEGIIIHAVGFGSPDEALLKNVSGETGGTYRFVADVDDLSDVFIDLFAEISESKQIVRNPFSLNVNAGGTTFSPQIDGNAGHIAVGKNDEFNVNDPTAPSAFSYSIDVSDGEDVSMAGVEYDCLEWERTGAVYENQTTGQEYAEVRCTKVDNSTRTEVPASNVDVYIDDEDVSALLNQPGDWWNEDLKNETLAPYLDGPNNETLDLESNQAIVVFEFDDGDGGTDRLVVLYRIGQSEQEAIPKHIFNIEVRDLVIGEDS